MSLVEAVSSIYPSDKIYQSKHSLYRRFQVSNDWALKGYLQVLKAKCVLGPSTILI